MAGQVESAARRFICALWVAPQLIEIHQNQVLWCSGDLEFTIHHFTPHEVQVSVDHCLGAVEKRTGNQKGTFAFHHDGNLKPLRTQRQQKSLSADQCLVITKTKN